MTFSLIHPSIRPHKWREIYDAWLAAAEHPENVEYSLVTDTKWGFGACDLVPWEHEREGNDHIWCSAGYVASVNAAAKEATGDMLIVIADDIWPAQGWDRVLLEASLIWPWQKDRNNTPEFAIWVNSGDRHIGTRGDIMAMPVVSRSRVERLGYLYYPGYLSMYADNDLAEHCMLDAAEGRCSLIVLQEPVFPHKHPANDPSIPMDSAYQWQNRPQAYSEGLELLKLRREAKFCEVTVPKKTTDRTRIAVCIAGDFFSLPWLMRWTDLLQLGAFVHDWSVFFKGGITNIYRMRIEMAREVLNDKIVDYVLWLDDDQLVQREHILQLVADLDEHPEVDMVAGWTVIGTDGFHTAPAISCGLVENKLAFAKDLMEAPGDLVEVLYTGFPLVLMRYQSLVDVGAEAFWPDKELEELPQGEDIAFCEAMRDAGKTIRVDRRVGPLPHLKLRDIAAGVLG